MTARDFLTVRPGFRVSGGATLGFTARCGNHTARRFRKLFKSTPVALNAPLAPQLGSVGASDDLGHGLHTGNDRCGAFHAADEEKRTSETAIRKPERV